MAEADQERERPSVHRIIRSDEQQDGLTRQSFSSYDMAYEQLERYYGDLCCSDDDRIEYVIVELDSDPGPGRGA
ncbi:hypothetical protein SynBOUM118_00911 [Synechococcus sp. BOUM118]|nr:hypothetical protein SynBOUM118_00911 [Synechococcus sp. BOUM118]